MVSITALILLTLLTWVDVFTYAGYLSTILVSQKVLAAIIVVLSLLYSQFPNKKVISPNYDSLIIMLVTLIYLGAVTLDGVLGQGTTHLLIGIRPESLLYATLSTLSLCLSLLIPIAKPRLERFQSFLIGFSLIFYFVRLLPIVTTQAAINLRKIITNPFASYEEKMGLEWGLFYDEILFVKSNTLTTDTILIPNDLSKYPLHSNLDLVRYFLYPRRLIQNPSGIDAPIYQLLPGAVPPLQLFKLKAGEL